jgi:predicted Holliday junction resolvase-like endonuclease
LQASDGAATAETSRQEHSRKLLEAKRKKQEETQRLKQEEKIRKMREEQEKRNKEALIKEQVCPVDSFLAAPPFFPLKNHPSLLCTTTPSAL